MPAAGAEFDRAFFEMVRGAVWVSWGLIGVSLWRMPGECDDIKVIVVVFGFPVVLTVLSLAAAAW